MKIKTMNISDLKHRINSHNYFFRPWSRILPDKIYLKLVCRQYLGYWINLKDPKTFNEKLQWLKLYGHKEKYVTMADKYLVKQYVANIIGDYYVVPCLGVWDNAKDIDFDQLPDKFVLKCNHNSGRGMCICKDKSKLDVSHVRSELDKYIHQGYFFDGRDKQYRDINRKIIADQFLDDHRSGELQDYKFWCFDGEPKFMYMTNKGKYIYENFYDMDFNPVAIEHGSPRMTPEYNKPNEFDEMKELAAILSKGMPFVRVDFFDIEGHVYFGEFTFFDWGGLKAFKSYDMDLELGQYIHLPIEQK